MQTLFDNANTFALATHNGKLTVSNPATGQHRTFEIRTQCEDAKFAPGRRVVSLLTGPDNGEDFTGFGFVNDDGTVQVWRSKLGTQFERFARMLQNLQAECDRFGLQAQWSARCRRCNRELTNPESLARGLGETCLKNG